MGSLDLPHFSFDTGDDIQVSTHGRLTLNLCTISCEIVFL